MDASALAETFGKNVRRSRRHADLSQQELADLCGLHRVEIGKIEQGQRLSRIDTILKVSGGVDASPCELMAGLRWSPARYVPGDFYVEDQSALAVVRAEPQKAGKA
jgi:transcriptional regulator with XRE-family HTH domain